METDIDPKARTWDPNQARARWSLKPELEQRDERVGPGAQIAFEGLAAALAAFVPAHDAQELSGPGVS